LSLVLVINPGGGSTKIAVFRDEDCALKQTIAYESERPSFEEILVHREELERTIVDGIERDGIAAASLDAIVGRGGALKPLASGTYRVNPLLVDDILTGNVQAKHASNLGALLAFEIGERLDKPAFMVDPVSVDEFIPEARLSGLPEIERKSLDHPLNSKMVAREAAREMGKDYRDVNMIVAHLGTGISVGAHEKGRMVDVSNANDGGPFSTQRTGSLPVTQIVDLCYAGRYTHEEMYLKLTTAGGLRAYLGTDDAEKAVRLAEEGDEKASLVLGAMVYQISKEIGAYATVLAGRVDAIVFTGGMAYSEYIISRIRRRVAFLASRIFVFPGEHEMESLAGGALRVLRGEEEPKQYK